jgi:hypothetical protein
MPDFRFRVEPNGTERIQVSWGIFWRNIRVMVDGAQVGTFDGRQAVLAGREFVLANGDKLHVRADSKAHPLVTYNGLPLMESGNAAFTGAYQLLYVIGILSVSVGLLASVFSIGFLLKLGIDWTSAIGGSLYLLLGWLTARYRSRVALGIGMALFAIDSVFAIYAAFAAGSMPFGALVMKGFILRGLWLGVKALGQQKRAGH